MFIRKIKIENFRTFNKFEMSFKDGLNVIIGSNNSGKTGLMHAIRLLSSPSDINIHDFNKNNLIQFKELYLNESPHIRLEYDIEHKIFEEDTTDESIIKLLPFLGIEKIMDSRSDGEEGVEYNIFATIQATFHLDSKYIEDYKKEVQGINDFDEYFLMLTRYVNSHYLWRYTNGNSETSIESKLAREIFDIQYINAERTGSDVAKEIKKDISTLLKDNEKKKEYDAFISKVDEELEDILKPSITKMSNLFENENNEIGLEKGNISITSQINSKLSAEDSYITEVKDTKSNYNLPLSYNGLGYNNLVNIYMLIKLSDIRKGIDFKILCLEEPEAHLHPAMQYKLFKYISNLNENNELNQQVFVTTHSSNITAVAGLDNMYIIQYDRQGKNSDCCQQSLKQQLTDDGENTFKSDAKNHLNKFLDVTRSDMLFADKVILVEGIAEKMLLPMFMEKVGYPYEDEHISIVEIGGKHFEYFVEVFNDNPVKKKVLCITDNDFKWFDDDSCLIETYSKYTAPHYEKLKNRYQFNEFKIVTQSKGGSTFEDELFIENFENRDIINSLFELSLSDTMASFSKSNGLSINNWIENKNSIDGRSTKLVSRYLDCYEKMISLDSKNKEFYEKLIFSKLFLHYVNNKKGDIALSLITDKCFFDDNGITKLNVPKYIEEGLEWLNQ
ncbi:MAG: ATP-dependent nuclease [Candidatus Scatomorpha sp.]|jgi:putative ATP-dependent endonuclease of OLD family